jgi:N-methylhydantoinase A/oxoprolinase/acetone carboxylase beta subunit
MRVGVDTGGTFTDVVTDAGEVRKVPSTPADPSHAVVGACRDLTSPHERPAVLAHGTTVATNALLERRLGRLALVTTRGFADVIEIARQARPSLYDAHVDRPPPLVPRAMRFEVGGRLDGHGRELESFDGEVPDVGTVDAVAVCLLHADLDPTHERAVAAVLRARGHEVVCSHEVSPEFREYERLVTTTADASLRAVCAPYLASLAPIADGVLVMTSAGGLVPLAEAAAHPARLLLSGPAGGVRAAAVMSRACGFADAVAFDMGGTSTDVCLVQDGVHAPTSTRRVAGLPVRLPSLAIHTIGAGGGSVARLDPGGALVVGPESAGAEPGPACYGRGGAAATVTDADLVLGRIPATTELPGLGRLDVAAARGALDRAGVSAEGVVAVVDAAMARAVRVVTVEQGVDPRDLALLAFGGAGPLHACAVADELGMRTVVVPPRAGVFSALGILCAPEQRELVETWPTPGSRSGLAEARAALAGKAAALVPGGDVDARLDCRYAGQSHELDVADVAEFPAVHARRNGYARPDVAVEVVALRARASKAAPLAVTDLPEPVRATARGPAVVAEVDCTLWVPDGWTATPGPAGAWMVERT